MRSSGDLFGVAVGSPDANPGAAHTIEITEAYHDYEPPFDIASTTRSLLDRVPENRLPGLRRIVLTNIDALPAGRKRAKTKARGRKVKIAETRGLYHQEWGADPAWIEIFVDKVTEGIPRFVFTSRFLRDIVVADVLYHEIGHHLHYTIAREHAERENVAEKWMRRLTRSYLRRKYWHFLPGAHLIGRLYRIARALAHVLRKRRVFSMLRASAIRKHDPRESWSPGWRKDHE